MIDTDFEALEGAVHHLRDAHALICTVTTCDALQQRMPELVDRLQEIGNDIDKMLNEDMHADLDVERQMYELFKDDDIDLEGMSDA